MVDTIMESIGFEMEIVLGAIAVLGVILLSPILIPFAILGWVGVKIKELLG